MSNEKMRKEFEVWMKNDIGVDCETMQYGKFDGDTEPKYHNKYDPDGAFIVSSMLAAWQASRASLCVELPLAFSDERATTYLTNVAKSLDSSGVRYK